ncbi:hypothetical protein ED733_004209 [Metarhizium rileyi]|uniref:Major facilitator superfamily (MFS) profile domain-containing protein n=1 Tax=Metarhizium rileyi (strain RCEF 4871) TaxID=1649241 RepID=A0A5C6G8E5_METRR|nr:hypothetical protein ED733_004209 [Metarhizium rileyi]
MPSQTTSESSPLLPQAPTPTGSDHVAASVVLSQRRAMIVITLVGGLSFFSSFCNGIVVIALPAMQPALGLPEGLLVWPSSSYFLTAGSCLLLAGSLADVVGNKRVNLVGSFLAAVSALACGLAKTAGEMITYRAIQGITYAIITPSSISIISSSVKEGRLRNMGFACMGFSQPIGFCMGLTLAGLFTETIGWRSAFYLAAAVSGLLFLIGIWALPRDIRPEAEAGPSIWKRLVVEIDLVGVAVASTGLALLSYVLATLSSDINNIRKTSSIVLLMLACLCVPLFATWMHCQVRNSRVALIPNSLWQSHVFTSLCIMVLLSNALANCMELYSSFFFQQVQGTSAVKASLQVAPSLVAGTMASILTGMSAHRMSSFLWMLLVSSVISTFAPLLMAVVRTNQPYWQNALFAQILTPINCDVLFPLGLLTISDIFPQNMQALSGAVFNTCAQLGGAIGMSVTQLIASSVTSGSPYPDKSSPEALMEGYRASFWTMFAWMVFLCVVCLLGMRRIGKEGSVDVSFGHQPSRVTL